GKSLSSLSRSTCASALMRRLMRCWRRGSVVFIAVRLDDSNGKIAAKNVALERSTLMSAWSSHRLTVLILTICAAYAAQAQDKPGQNIPTLRTQSNVVLAPALVTDKEGKLIFGLQASDFIIEDDGMEQPVSMDEAEPEEAVSLVIAIQSGRSALREFERMKGLSSMLDQIVGQPQVQTAIVVFDANVELAQDFSFDSAQTESFLRSMVEGPRRNMKNGNRSGAAIYDAVRYSANLLRKQPDDSRRILLLISETRSWQPCSEAGRCHRCRE